MKSWVKISLGIIIIVLLLYGYYPVMDMLILDKEIDEKIEFNIIKSERDSLKEELVKLTNLDYDDYNYVYGKVILRELYNFSEEIVIKTSEEVKAGWIVVNEDGVVGIISKVVDDIAYVDLVTSKKTSLSVIVNNEYGKVSYNNGLKLENINKNNVKVGDIIYTSGLTKYPKGLVIGVVSKIDKDIKVTSNVNDLYHVLVIKEAI